jgi:hypothetical protein
MTPHAGYFDAFQKDLFSLFGIAAEQTFAEGAQLIFRRTRSFITGQALLEFLARTFGRGFEHIQLQLRTDLATE